MTHQPSYDFRAALHTILTRIAEAETMGSDSEELGSIRRDALRYGRQLDVLQAELERMLTQTDRTAAGHVVSRAMPSKRLACHHADSADAARLIEGDLPPWMIDCSEPH
ncbi:MAG TPA: hypothetical protein VGD69_23690 [Herpetosiphonaceae bacterium]